MTVMSNENDDRQRSDVQIPVVSYNGSYAWQANFYDTELDLRDWLAAIVDGSDDAIISKDLQGNIKTWNRGAQRLFGYQPEEVIGKPITLLIPEDRLNEEPAILAQIRAGMRVEHFETVRKKKDGTLFDISLTISPIRDARGVIVGASKIARDITERRKAQEKLFLVLGEMHHRVKNLFALANGIVSLSGREAQSVDEFRQRVQARLSSLARAHELTMPAWNENPDMSVAIPLQTLIRTILDPYDGCNISLSGADPAVSGKSLTNLSLLLHEFATNAAKHGALSSMGGCLSIIVEETIDTVRLLWSESVEETARQANTEGFGTRLEAGLSSALNASVERKWLPSGLEIKVTIPVDKLVSGIDEP